ncbi:bifunctional metallophosphatase/5'-nucleotidase [Brevibacterium ravenspurgense]|uniref:bifunctional metallophosphatase/5'-nucleotidase n=1 Tax=Brevibacterium ravenspurgense TaxID=479117 RepID=UPI0007802C9B|nr:bifunctional UDP-sugar hydrolase/5'-nucleotidase [Brevibacterium ravenspurgense]
MLKARRALYGGAAAAVLVAPLGAMPVFAEAPEGTKLQVLGITDFHGRIADPDGQAMASTVENERAEAEGSSVLLSAGDNIGASTYVSSSQKDEPTIDYLNALGLDASAMGNHEYDRGFKDFSERVLAGEHKAEFPHLAANVYKKGTKELSEGVKDYEIIEKDGIKIAVIGVVTQETASLVSPSGIDMLDFGKTAEAVERTSKKIAELPEGEAPDVTIVQAHVGMSEAAAGDSCDAALGKSKEVKSILDAADDSVDAFFLGHTHIPVNCTYKKGDNTVPVMQAGQYGKNVAAVNLTSKGDGNWTVDSQEILDTKGQEASTEITNKTGEIIKAATEKSQEIGKEVAGEIDEDITRAFKDGKEDRGAESTLGNLVADALNEGTGLSQLEKSDFGITNPGGLRTDLKVDDIFQDEKPGEVTVAELNEVLPFANDHGVVSLKGSDVIQLFEEQWQPEGSSRPFLHLGISKELEVIYDSEADRGKHVVSVKVGGEDIDPDKTYRVATLSFLAAGGDNFSAFANGKFEQSGLTDFEIWEAYFNARQDEGKKVKADKDERQADAALDVMKNGDLEVSIKHPSNKDDAFEIKAGTTEEISVQFNAKKKIEGPLQMTLDLPKGVSVDLGKHAVKDKKNVAQFDSVPEGKSEVKFKVTASKDAGKKDEPKAGGKVDGAEAASEGAEGKAEPVKGPKMTATLIAAPNAGWWDNNPLPIGGKVEIPVNVLPADAPAEAEQPEDGDKDKPEAGDNAKPEAGDKAKPEAGDKKPGTAANKPLPRTGTEVGLAAAAAVALLLTGAGALALSRRKNADVN